MAGVGSGGPIGWYLAKRFAGADGAGMAMMEQRRRSSRGWMPVVLALSVLATVVVGAPAPSWADVSPAPRAAQTDPLAFRSDWGQRVTGSAITTSSPVVVANGTKPFVVVGDVGGNLRAFSLSTGAPVPGWSNVRAGYEIRAPLSSDGASVYVPVAQDGPASVPQFKKFDAKGRQVWSTNPRTRYTAPGVGFLLGGMSLANSGGWKGIGPSSGQSFYGFNLANGAKQWSFLNADSTMATPALADVRGLGSPQVITSNDRSEPTAGRRVVGFLRVLTLGGRQLCSATQLASGTTYTNEGYNNSSPVVMEVSGKPLIVLGSTGPRQYGAGDNQLLGYNANCTARWTSAPLAGRIQAAPALADVMGRGTPQIVQLVGMVDGAKRYPRVYVLDPATGRTLVDTGTRLREYGAQILYPPGTSVVTADVDGDGAQDLFVPASRMLVISGRTHLVLTKFAIPGAIQNTPIITELPGHGLRITLAGYSGSGGWISSYTSAQGSVGKNAWTRFANSSRLTGVQGTVNG